MAWHKQMNLWCHTGPFMNKWVDVAYLFHSCNRQTCKVHISWKLGLCLINNRCFVMSFAWCWLQRRNLVFLHLYAPLKWGLEEDGHVPAQSWHSRTGHMCVKARHWGNTWRGAAQGTAPSESIFIHTEEPREGVLCPYHQASKAECKQQGVCITRG